MRLQGRQATSAKDNALKRNLKHATHLWLEVSWQIQRVRRALARASPGDWVAHLVVVSLLRYALLTGRKAAFDRFLAAPAIGTYFFAIQGRISGSEFRC